MKAAGCLVAEIRQHVCQQSLRIRITATPQNLSVSDGHRKFFVPHLGPRSRLINRHIFYAFCPTLDTYFTKSTLFSAKLTLTDSCAVSGVQKNWLKLVCTQKCVLIIVRQCPNLKAPHGNIVGYNLTLNSSGVLVAWASPACERYGFYPQCQWVTPVIEWIQAFLCPGAGLLWGKCLRKGLFDLTL